MPLLQLTKIIQERAKDRCIATAFAFGSGHLFETTFEKEVHSDLTGERCVLMGLLQGAFLAQYEVLERAWSFAIRSI